MSITTKALKYIVNDIHNQGTGEKDYSDIVVIEEMKAELNRRLTALAEKEHKAMIKRLDERVDYLDDQGVPPLDMEGQPFPDWVLDQAIPPTIDSKYYNEATTQGAE